jgi:RNA polymerase sigma-70 factor (ECF subfamily)
VPAAIQALDAQYRAEVGVFLAGLRLSPDAVDDVAQAVREQLLVGRDGRPPRIEEYSGRGSLGGWLRVVTVRRALASRRKRTEALSDGDAEPAGAAAEASPVDPEIDLLKRRHAGALNAALRAALSALGAEQRDLLRKHFLDGATLPELAAMLGVSRATVGRRLVAARGGPRRRAPRARRAAEPPPRRAGQPAGGDAEPARAEPVERVPPRLTPPARRGRVPSLDQGRIP